MHHGVRIKDSALVTAAVLSHRYITDRFLPDKAIDLVDEAAAKLRTEIDSMPAELDEVSRRVMQLEIEREALKKETDKASRARLEKLEKELARAAGASRRAARPLGASRRAPSARLRELRRRIEETKLEIEKAERAVRPEPRRRAQVRHAGAAGDAARRRGRPAGEAARAARRLIKEEVDEDDIAEVVARWTGIPVSKLWKASCRSCCSSRSTCTSASSARTRRSRAVADAVIRARAGLKDPNRPIGSFIFLGPDRRRQDRARPRPRRVPVRRRERR